jgi:hypothetical protein
MHHYVLKIGVFFWNFFFEKENDTSVCVISPQLNRILSKVDGVV